MLTSDDKEGGSKMSKSWWRNTWMNPNLQCILVSLFQDSEKTIHSSEKMIPHIKDKVVFISKKQNIYHSLKNKQVNSHQYHWCFASFPEKYLYLRKGNLIQFCHNIPNDLVDALHSHLSVIKGFDFSSFFFI